MDPLTCTHDGAEHGPYRSVCATCLREYGARVRREALEEAAQVCDDEWLHTGEELAFSIRRLAASPKEETDG